MRLMIVVLTLTFLFMVDHWKFRGYYASLISTQTFKLIRMAGG